MLVMELKLCPFCGGEASIGETDFEGKTIFIAFCEECGISTPADEDEQVIIKLWNRRVPDET